MVLYRVYLVTEASASVEVEADNPEDAVEKAFDRAPSNCHACPDVGDWALLSEKYPNEFSESDDVEEIN